MSAYKTWAYDILSNEEVILCIDSLSLLLIYSPGKILKGSYQLADHASLKIINETGLEIKLDTQSGLHNKYEFENIEARDEFVSRLRRACKKHEKTMQGLFMEISVQKVYFMKYNYKNSKLSKKFFWFSSDLNELRWAGTKTSKKFSRVSVFEIMDVLYGPWSRNFERVKQRPEGKNLPFHLCLSIQTQKKTIDLQAIDEKQLKIWLCCLHYIVQTKNLRIPNYFTINRYPFLRFRLKISQTAHKLGLTFATYLKLKLNKIIYNFSATIPQLSTSRIVNPSNQNTSRISHFQERSRRSFIHHKRNSTLPMHQANSYDDHQGSPFSAQIVHPGSFYTDRRSQLNEFSRHSSASNVSINYPMSQRIENPYYNSMGNSTKGFQNTNKTIEVDYGVDQHRMMTQSHLNKPISLKSSDSLPLQRNPNFYSNAVQSQLTSKNMNKGDFRPQVIRPHEESGSPVNLYFNVQGSKEISGIMPSSIGLGVTPGKILPNDLNLDFTKIGSPPGNNGLTSTHQTIKSDGSNFGTKKMSPPSNNKENVNVKEKTRSNERQERIKDKENFSPEDIEKKKNASKLKMNPLNLRGALNEKTDLNEKVPPSVHKEFQNESRSLKLEKAFGTNIENILPVKRGSKGQTNAGISAWDNVILDQKKSLEKKSFFEVDKSLDKSIDRSELQGSNKTHIEMSLNQPMKRRVKLTIDKKALKTKILKALQNTHTPTHISNSHIVNQSFAHDMIPANLSIDISKIDLDLDTATKSKVSLNDDKTENQFTSRFRAEHSDESPPKRSEHIKENEHHPEEFISMKNLTLGRKSEKESARLETVQKKPKHNLSLDASLINLETENYNLKQLLEEANREKEIYREKAENLCIDFQKMQNGYESEKKKKDVYIETLMKSIEKLSKERTTLTETIAEERRKNEILIEREGNRIIHAQETSEKSLQEMERLQMHIKELEDLHRKLNIDLTNYKQNNDHLQNESEKMQEIISQLHQEKETYQTALLSPKLTEKSNKTSSETTERAKQLMAQLKEENNRLKDENNKVKKILTIKLSEIKDIVTTLRADRDQLRSEVEENYENFEEVWPHLLHIFEYKGDQNSSLKVKLFTLSKENHFLREQLRKKVESN